MTEMTGDCPECGPARVFIQPHPGAGQCPDTADGACPEWFCLVCGTAMLIGVPDPARDPVTAGTGYPGRVRVSIAATGPLAPVA